MWNYLGSMPVLLVDFDHTLYSPSLPTLKHIDKRISLFIQAYLGVDLAKADHLRQELCSAYGTTLRGLMATHDLNPHTYFDFIHQVEEQALPPKNDDLFRWLAELPYPAYVFTNARADWVEKCFQSMGLSDWVGEGKPLLGILDLAFMDWLGKPHPSAYAAVEKWVHERHGHDSVLHLFDDRADNLQAAHRCGWVTHWVRPMNASSQDLPFAKIWNALHEVTMTSIAEVTRAIRQGKAHSHGEVGPRLHIDRASQADG